MSQPVPAIRPLQWAIAFVAMAGAASALEGIWYLDVAEPLYQREIGRLLNVEFDGFVAILFYLVYALGALVFALRPALRSGRWQQAAGLGALYGFFCFSAHNLTDLADVRGYTATIAAVDIAWGVCMSAAASSLAFLASRRLG
jgi:uncharacterized membrane protein